MGDKNNNLEDFLRKKFSDIEDSEESWTRPSLTVRKEVLEEIIEPAQKKRRKVLWFFLLFLGVLSSLILIKCFTGEKKPQETIFYSKSTEGNLTGVNVKSSKKSPNSLDTKSEEKNVENISSTANFSKNELIERNSLLRTVIQNQNDIITQLKKEQSDAPQNINKNRVDEKYSSKTKSKDKFEVLLEANDKLELTKKKLQELNKLQRKKIEILNNEKQLLLDSLNRQIYASHTNQGKEEGVSIAKNIISSEVIDPIVITELEEDEVIVESISSLLGDDFGFNKPKNKVRFEAGYQLGVNGGVGEVIEYVEKQGVITNQVKDKFLVSHVHGLNVGVSPLKNFWIKTGAHIGNMNLHQKHNVAFTYNSGSSTTFSSSSTADMIHGLSKKGIGKLEQSINAFAVAQGVANGDNLNLNFQTNLVLTYLQIPLEFNYTYGKKRLQALFQLGGQWNMLNYQYYMYGFGGEISNQNSMDIYEQAASKPEESSVQYWGLHAGAGLSYNISKHWNIQGLLSYEYHFQYNAMNQQQQQQWNSAFYAAVPLKTTSPISNMKFGVKIGLNYRF